MVLEDDERETRSLLRWTLGLFWCVLLRAWVVHEVAWPVAESGVYGEWNQMQWLLEYG